jgi:hypothetical protein
LEPKRHCLAGAGILEARTIVEREALLFNKLAVMPRRRKLDLEAIRASLNIECPHCHATLRPAEYMRLD